MIYEVKKQKGGYSDSNSVNLTEFKTQTCFFVDENKICYNVTTDDVKEETYYDKTKTIASLVFCGVLGLFIIISTAD